MWFGEDLVARPRRNFSLGVSQRAQLLAVGPAFA
jgi:hypothetical protein